MFETRLHRIQANDALSKRKLWEGWLQWANKLGRIDSDNIARHQFDRLFFTPGTFLEMFSAGLDAEGTDPASLSGYSGTMIAASKEIISLDISGEYWLNWSLTLEAISGECRFAGGIPFVGNTFVESAKDFKAELGWYNNMALLDQEMFPTGKIGYGGIATGTLDEKWGRYGFAGSQANEFDVHPFDDGHLAGTPKGQQIHTEDGSYSSDKDQALKRENTTIHLSGAGSSYVGRVTGNIGVLLFCQDGSRFDITDSRLTLHRRVR
tara:strand:+ start:6748 stop:7542 length:795 start_codon:yes stop_codon:yes gene_type:complete